MIISMVHPQKSGAFPLWVVCIAFLIVFVVVRVVCVFCCLGCCWLLGVLCKDSLRRSCALSCCLVLSGVFGVRYVSC